MPLPLRKAIDYARQVADGLAAAHARGIAHRDIKPENLFVTDEGRVKILDFGLAHAVASAGVENQTLTRAPITDAGTIVGTVGYMAPEQVRAQSVDGRADLFALGCVLYEMCTGTRAFKGETPADTMSAVLSSDPREITVSGQTTPPALDRIVRRCLEKVPTERFQSARDLSFALDALSSLSGAAQPPVAAKSSSIPWALPVTAAAALIIGVIAGRSLLPSDRDAAAEVAPAMRLEFASNSGRNPVGFLTAISPDGHRLAFYNGSSVAIRDLATAETIEVPTNDIAFVAAWSPRGDELLYFDQPNLVRFRLVDRTKTPVTNIDSAFRGAAWLADDTLVLALGAGGLWRVPASGGKLSKVTNDEVLYTLPTPIGRRADQVLVLRAGNGSARDRQVVAVRVSDGRITPIVANEIAARYTSGMLLLPRVAGLFVMPFDESSLTASGEPVAAGPPIVLDMPDGKSSLAVSLNGVVSYRTGTNVEQQFEWLNRKGVSERKVALPGPYGSFALSPDGRRIVVRVVASGAASAGLTVIDDARGVASPLSVPSGAVSDPVWDADGTQVFYRLDSQLVRQSITSNVREVIRKEQIYPDHVSRDGRWLLGGNAQDGNFALFLLSADGSGERQPIEVGADTDEATFSPDGGLISFQSSRSGRFEIYLARFPVTAERWQVSGEGGVQARWSADGQSLYYLDLKGRMMRVTVSSSHPDQLGSVEPMFDLGIGLPNAQLEQYAVHGDRFLVLREPPGGAGRTVIVISNWASLLARKPK